jgi:2-polyprenyl-6-methoxyphenol hydroxylase-like FAD-dependent oxidoreductase
VGDGWVLVGDAAGFADPIFSTGTYLAMRGAEMLADALVSGSSEALARYEREWLAELCAWQRIIGLWYDGRLFSLLRLGRFMRRLPPARPVDSHIGRHMTRIFTGEAGRNGYGQALLSVVAPIGRAGARSLAIR